MKRLYATSIARMMRGGFRFPKGAIWSGRNALSSTAALSSLTSESTPLNLQTLCFTVQQKPPSFLNPRLGRPRAQTSAEAAGPLLPSSDSPVRRSTRIEANSTHPALKATDRKTSRTKPKDGLALVRFVDVDPRHSANKPIDFDAACLLKGPHRTLGVGSGNTVNRSRIMSEHLDASWRSRTVGSVEPFFKIASPWRVHLRYDQP